MYAEKTYLIKFGEELTLKVVDYTMDQSSQNPDIRYVKFYTLNGYSYEEIAAVAESAQDTITVYDMIEVAPAEYDSNPVLKPVQRLVGFNKNPLITHLPENDNYEVILFMETQADIDVESIRSEVDMVELAILE